MGKVKNAIFSIFGFREIFQKNFFHPPKFSGFCPNFLKISDFFRFFRIFAHFGDFWPFLQMKSAQLWGFHLQKPHNPKIGPKLALFCGQKLERFRRFWVDSSISLCTKWKVLSKYMLESLWKRLVKAVEGGQKRSRTFFSIYPQKRPFFS